MLCIDDLLKLSAFQTLSEARLQWVCDRAHELNLQRGSIIEQEGAASRGFFILVSGRIGVTRTKPVGSGSGLGLDAVRRIVENRHYGTITFDSKPGRTRFTVYLPISSTKT